MLMRAERILADWLERRYPRIPDGLPARWKCCECARRCSPSDPHQAHDFTFLRRETLARVAACGGLRAGTRHVSPTKRSRSGTPRATRSTPYREVVPALEPAASAFPARDAQQRQRRSRSASGSRTILKSRCTPAHSDAPSRTRGPTRALADALTLTPAEILFVGDEPHADVVGPRAAGMQTVWVNRGGLFGPTRCPRRMPASPTSTELEAVAENVNVRTRAPRS